MFYCYFFLIALCSHILIYLRQIVLGLTKRYSGFPIRAVKKLVPKELENI